jgi:hypothetical protein
VDAGQALGRDHHGVAGAEVTVRDLAVAAFVLAALVLGQVDNGDGCQRPRAGSGGPQRY